MKTMKLLFKDFNVDRKKNYSIVFVRNDIIERLIMQYCYTLLKDFTKFKLNDFDKCVNSKKHIQALKPAAIKTVLFGLCKNPL